MGSLEENPLDVMLLDNRLYRNGHVLFHIKGLKVRLKAVRMKLNQPFFRPQDHVALFKNEKFAAFLLDYLLITVLLREQLFNLFTKKVYTKRLLT